MKENRNECEELRNSERPDQNKMKFSKKNSDLEVRSYFIEIELNRYECKKCHKVIYSEKSTEFEILFKNIIIGS